MDTPAARQPTSGQHTQEMAASRKQADGLARALDHEKEILVRADEERRFSHALTNFLEQQCVKDTNFSVTDKQLFRRFRAFWMQAPEQFDHPALLGQFRVELTLYGFLSDSAGKHPRWLGLTLREQDNQKPRKKEKP